MRKRTYNMVNGYKIVDTIKLQAPGDVTVMIAYSTIQLARADIDNVYWNRINIDSSVICQIYFTFQFKFKN